MMRVNATFTVVAVFLGGAPGRFIHEHVKDETVFVQVQTLQVEVQIRARKETLRHEVILDTFVLEVQIYLTDCPQISQLETRHLIWLPRRVECHD